ncbi:hypothetical protein CYY_000362 [Polysphondylium violaceum]|uniref:Purple acid phosphatase N-terminal domain-containing protein n=1 Tax=Polysphondylium violaceum TaxID=133409 RepID=A0A8J4Q3V9_9MYCE|nr:hypothetical protein CYY_000362 [Polysphondylium violaceum]
MTFSVEEKTLLGIGALDAFLLLIFIIHFTIVYLLAQKNISQYGTFSSSSSTRSSSNEIELQNNGDNNNQDVYDATIKGNYSNPSSSSATDKDMNYIDFLTKRQFRIILVESVACLVIFELLILVLVMFDKLHIAAGVIIMFFVAALHWVSMIMPSNSSIIRSTLKMNAIKKWAHRVSWKIYNGKKQSHYGYWIGLFVILVAVLALNIVLEGTCEDELVLIDTRIMRRFMKASCATTGLPCFVYLTLNEHPHSSIIANFHTALESGVDVPTPTCVYDNTSRTEVAQYLHSATGNHYKMPIEVIRYVNWVHIEDLTPDTVYYFRCGSDKYGYSEERKFRTASDNPHSNFTFIVGGDVDVGDTANRISSVGAKQEPAFAMVGGDLAYDHAQYSCYRIVDKWLNNWQTRMITPSGLTIPIIASIGNHEVIGDYEASKDRVPFFLRYFPQMNKVDDNPSHVDDRLSYNPVSIGGANGTVIFNLDSGHASSMSVQRDWMQQQLDSKYVNTKLRFSIYHVPMYPTYRLYENTRSANVRDNWLSLFDTYKFNIGFENHDHAYKRTKPMHNNQVVDLENNTSNTTSTVYIGDGAWGVSLRPLPDSRWYQSFSKATNYITKISIDNQNSIITYESIDDNDQTFDSGTIKF